MSATDRLAIAAASHGADAHEAATGEPESLSYLLGRRKTLGLAIGFGSYNYVFYLLLAWLPSYLTLALHIDAYHSFLYTSLPWLVATFGDLAVGGWLVDALIRHGYDASRVRQAVLIGGTTFGLGILGAAHAHNATQALIWISISIGGLSAAAPVGWSVPALIASRNNVGRVGGIMNFSNQVSGIAASTITGYLFAAQPGGVGLWNCGDLSGDRHLRIHLSAGKDRAGEEGAGCGARDSVMPARSACECLE